MTEGEDRLQVRTAKQLLLLADARGRRRLVLGNVLLLALCFAGHSLSHQWDSPLSLVPETALAILMGFSLCSILSVWRFPLVGRYVDWQAVQEDAAPSGQ